MISFVALLRGINVSTSTLVGMAELRGVFKELGYTEVTTYLRSGNVFFHADEPESSFHESRIKAAINERFKLEIRTLVKTKPELEQVLAANPFTDEIIEKDRTLFVAFTLDGPLSDKAKEQLRNMSSPNELIEPANTEFYILLLRSYFSDSHMGKSNVLRKLKIDTTARNWNSLTNLIRHM